MRKQTFCICENKGLDQLRSNYEADQGWVTRIFSLVIHSEGFTKAARNG